MIWTVLAAMALAAWIGLLCLRGGFWRVEPRLDGVAGAASAPGNWPGVAAIVPARDEAETVGEAVRSLAEQDYPGRFSIVVVDDESSDGTARIARDAAGDADAAVIRSGPLAHGWKGKVWALSGGFAHVAAERSDARYLWLSDADVVHPPDMLRALVCEAEARSLDLLSLMVRLRAESFWERLLIPPFVFFFRKLFPFAWVNDSGRRIAAAAGGCVLLRRSALERIGGIGAIRNALIDDIALARAVKPGGPIRLAMTGGSTSIRRYRSLGGIWAMVARSAFDLLRYSALALAGTVVAMTIMYLAPPLLVLSWPFHGDLARGVLGAAAWIAMALAAYPTGRLYGLSPWAGFALPVAAALFVAMTVDSARCHWTGGGRVWKSRVYASERGGG